MQGCLAGSWWYSAVPTLGPIDLGGLLAEPQHLGGTHNHSRGFEDVEELGARLFITHFVKEDFVYASCYLSRFQPILRYLHLKTKYLITFIVFFPLLEGV